MGKEAVVKKAVRLGESWDTFQSEHPEIKVRRNSVTGKIEGIDFPNGTYSLFIIYNSDEILYIDYVSVSGEHSCFPL